MAMDLQLLFTAERLQLNPHISKGIDSNGRFTLKTLDSGSYLTIDRLQLGALLAFSKPTTVPEALRTLIIERKCPALRDFYELVLKAQRTGVLQTGPSPVSQVVPLMWKFGLPSKVARWLGVVSILLGLLALGFFPPPLIGMSFPQFLSALLVGYVSAAIAISLGSVFGVSAVHAAGGDGFHPRIGMPWLFPHFSINLRDSLLAEASAQLGIHLVGLAPISLLVTFLCIFRSPAALLPAIIFIAMIRPCFGGAISSAIHAGLGKPALDTSRNLIFPANKSWGGLHHSALMHFDPSVIAARLIWAVLWIVCVTLFALRSAGYTPSGLSFGWHFWVNFVFVLAGAVVLPAGVIGYASLMETVRRPLKTVRRYWRNKEQRKQAVDQPVTMKTISSILVVSPLCQRMQIDRRRALEDKLTVVTFRQGAILSDFSMPATDIHLIVSGAVDVYRRTPKGRPQKAWQAIEGDFIGAEDIVEPHPLGWKLVARSPLIVLRMPRDIFQKEIMDRLGAATVLALTHHVPFLRQNQLCRHWHPQAINRFATITRVATFPSGGYVLSEDHDSQGLFFIYEGEAFVERNKRRLSRLGIGGFIGEIGLLQNSAATASVVADGPLTCLTIDKTYFFRFLTQNYEVALEVERLSSQRLGRPVFPLRPDSFEVY
jgi:CRP-like cAMP-binding protein